MITVKDLFLRAGWEKTAARLVENYENVEKSMEGFRKAFEAIIGADNTENLDDTVVHVERFDEDGQSYYDVYGTVPGDPERYCLGTHTLTEWAGFYVDDDVLKSLPPDEVAAHILWDATFYGFTDDEINAFWEDLKQRVEEWRSNPEVGVPWREVLAELGENDVRSQD
ncbi:MAG: hypothetical protein H5U03_09755 [Clostridia bacterium]|nr:hypothetical protein [Clostridia bacterium]